MLFTDLQQTSCIIWQDSNHSFHQSVIINIFRFQKIQLLFVHSMFVVILRKSHQIFFAINWLEKQYLIIEKSYAFVVFLNECNYRSRSNERTELLNIFKHEMHVFCFWMSRRYESNINCDENCIVERHIEMKLFDCLNFNV